MKFRNAVTFILRGGILLAAVLIFFGIFSFVSYHTPITFLTWPKAVLGQTVFELTCPLGTRSFEPLQTSNIITGKSRQNYCIDIAGNVSQNVTGTGIFKQLNGTFYLSNGNPQGWTGTDTFSQLNSVYAAIPSSSGKGAAKIVVDPNPGSCYVVSNELVFNTNGKPVNFDGQGACFDASSMTTTDAMDFDWGQGNPNINVRVENFRLIGPCVTTACAGVTSRGIVQGPTNGLVGVLFENVYVGLLGTGKGFLNDWVNGSGNAFLNQHINCNAIGAAIGVNYPTGGGGDSWVTGSFSQNAIGRQNSGSGSAMNFTNIVYDDNTTTAINRLSTTTITVTDISPNWENTSNENPFIVFTDNQSQGTQQFIGGMVQNDSSSGAMNNGCANSTAQCYFNVVGTGSASSNSVTLIVKGLTIFSAGQTVTQAFFLGNSQYDIDVSYAGTQPTNLFNTSMTGALKYALVGGSAATRISLGAQNFKAAGRFNFTDSGVCTMTAGTCTLQTFPSGLTYSSVPNCFLTWTGTGTLTGILKPGATTTSVTPTSSVGTDTAQISWVCFGS